MLVIFDFDGTLADTWPWLAEELVAGAERLGYRSVTRSELEDLRRVDTRAIFERLQIPPDRLPLVAADLRQRAEANASHFRLFEGISDLVRTLHTQGSTLAVVSSNTEGTVRVALGADLAPLFAVFACGIDVFGKAAAFAHVMRTAQASAADTVAVGDETRDLDGARSAGIRGFAVEWGYAEAALLRSRAPGRTATSVEQLLGLLNAEEGRA